MTTALWWLRRDLRLTDNQALAAALAHADRVIPVFVLDPTLLDSPYVGPKRVAFLLGGLRRLDEDLRARGSRLIVRSTQLPRISPWKIPKAETCSCLTTVNDEILALLDDLNRELS